MQSELSSESMIMAVPRRVSWVPPNQPSTEPHRRKRIPFKNLSRQRSFSLESHANVSKNVILDTNRKCLSLKSSPLISAHVPTSSSSSTNKNFNCNSPIGVQKQYSTPERSIMAELRRSSEIFKSILLNLSIKENDSLLEAVHSSTSSIIENDVDIDDLLVIHRQRCIENYHYFADSSSSSSTSSAYSSPASSPDRSSLFGSELNDCDNKFVRYTPIVDSCCLRINTNLPPVKLGEISEAYTRKFLYELPAIFLAIVKGNTIITGLLLKYGANSNYQVKYLKVLFLNFILSN